MISYFDSSCMSKNLVERPTKKRFVWVSVVEVQSNIFCRSTLIVSPKNETSIEELIQNFDFVSTEIAQMKWTNCVSYFTAGKPERDLINGRQSTKRTCFWNSVAYQRKYSSSAIISCFLILTKIFFVDLSLKLRRKVCKLANVTIVNVLFSGKTLVIPNEPLSNVSLLIIICETGKTWRFSSEWKDSILFNG